MSSVESPYLKVALRRLRLQSAVVRAEQSGALKPDEMDRLLAQLAAARETEREAREAGSGDLPIDRVARRLDLRPLDEQVLLAAVALEADPLFALTVTALAGEEPRTGLSAKLLAHLFGFAGDETLDLGLGPDHPLVQAGLLESGGGVGLVETLRPWRAPTRVVSFLGGTDGADPVLARCGGPVALEDGLDLEHLAEPLAMLERALAADEDALVLLEGPDGAGRRTLVAAAARKVGREAVALDAGRLSVDGARFTAELRALRRECWLRGAVPIVARLDALARRDARTGERLAEIGDALESPGADLPELRRRVIRMRVDLPPPTTRERVWARALGTTLGADGDGPSLGHLAQRYTMTPGVIRRAAANARMLAHGRDLSVADVQGGVSAEIHERFGGLAARMRVSHRWEDLVLPVDTLDEVRAFTARASHAALVYEQWGFRTKLQRGLGLAALFSGPPGTGKTMVAGLIAGTLGLDLYMVDLAQIVSKWVGETEKQLARVFDAAAMGQAVLLFDEADALFSKRTEVKSSNDRYANLEVNYLLQRIEDFGGVAILTTNLEAQVDPAFKRRLAAEVRFYPPDRDERERLWRSLFPSQAPVDEDLDYPHLADHYKDMCGGHIRNAVLRAAFLAASEERPIAMDHLHRAARTEYRAMGKVL